MEKGMSAVVQAGTDGCPALCEGVEVLQGVLDSLDVH